MQSKAKSLISKAVGILIQRQLTIYVVILTIIIINLACFLTLYNKKS